MKNPHLSALIVALLVLACGDTEPRSEYEPGKGAMQLPLVKADSEGKMYRLVGATFELKGPVNATLTDNGEDTISMQLTTGVYYIELKGDYHLEEVTPNGPGRRIEAKMISPNPIQFTIAEKTTTAVVFLFKIPLPGAVEVGIQVDRGGWIAGQMEFTRLYLGGRPCYCAELVGNTRPFALSFETMTVTRLEPGPDGVKKIDVLTGPLTFQFGGGHLNSLEKIASELQGGHARIVLSATGEGSKISIDDILAGHPGDLFLWAAAAGAPFTGLLDSDGYPLLPQSLPFNIEFEVGDYNGGIGYGSKVAGKMTATGVIP